MYHLESLKLDNYLTWDEVELHFKPGVTQIFGENRSGKSVLVSPLSAILYDTFNVPKSAYATLQMSTADHSYDFSAFNKNRTRNSFKVVIDEKDQSVETRDAALKLIHQNFGFYIQESLFSTTVSVSGLASHPLTTGKASTRLDWIHEIFAYASLLDAYIERVERKLKPAREGSIKYKLLKDQISALVKPDIPKHSVETLRQHLEKNKERLLVVEDDLRQIENALQVDKGALEKPKYTIAEAKERLAMLREQHHTLQSAQLAAEAYQKVKPKVERLKREQAEAKAAYKALCEKYQQKIVRPDRQIAILEELIEEQDAALRKIERTNATYEEQAEQRALAERSLPDGLTLKKVQTRAETVLEKTSILKRTLKSVRSGDEHCSVCGSDISAKTHDPKVLEQEIADFEDQAKKLVRYTAIFEARATDFVAYQETEPVEKALKALRLILKAARAYVDTTEKFDGLEEVEPTEFDEDAFERVQKQLRIAERQLIDAKGYAQAVASQKNLLEDNAYTAWSSSQLKKELAVLTKEKEQLYRKINRLSDMLVETQTNEALLERYTANRTQLVSQARDVKSCDSDFKILMAARKSLGRDGFRTKKLEETLELFVNNLNDLAPLMWNEPYKFEIETAARKCDVIVHRNKRRGDAFTLSGSERRSWQLISALAILRILPDNRRCDTIILDELEANMSTHSRHMMMHDFIPELRKTVPNVVIISPLASRDLGLQPDRRYVVEKNKGRSRLVQ